jgi:hypothetical protein
VAQRIDALVPPELLAIHSRIELAQERLDDRRPKP